MLGRRSTLGLTTGKRVSRRDVLRAGETTARVCVVRCHYYRDTRVQREVGALLDLGHEIELVCLRGPGEPRLERRANLAIRRLPLGHAVGASAGRLAVEYIVFFVLAFLVVSLRHALRRFALIQVNSVPDALVFVALVPRLTGSRVVLDLQEPMPEFFQTKFADQPNRPGIRVIVAAEQLSIRFAHAAITVTEPMRRAFIDRGAAPEKITVVMDGSDPAVFCPGRFPRRPPDGRFVLISHGTIEPQYGLDTAIEAVALLLDDIPGLELHIFGDGSYRSYLQELARRLDLCERVRFSEGFVPVDELVKALAMADVGVVAMKRDAFRDLTLAGKMFDFIAMKIPMVVSKTRSVAETFPAGCFELFAAGDAEDLARGIRRLHDDPQLAVKYAARAADVGAAFSWPVQRQRYCDLMTRLITG